MKKIDEDDYMVDEDEDEEEEESVGGNIAYKKGESDGEEFEEDCFGDPVDPKLLAACDRDGYFTTFETMCLNKTVDELRPYVDVSLFEEKEFQDMMVQHQIDTVNTHKSFYVKRRRPLVYAIRKEIPDMPSEEIIYCIKETQEIEKLLTLVTNEDYMEKIRKKMRSDCRPVRKKTASPSQVETVGPPKENRQKRKKKAPKKKKKKSRYDEDSDFEIPGDEDEDDDEEEEQEEEFKGFSGPSKPLENFGSSGKANLNTDTTEVQPPPPPPPPSRPKKKKKNKKYEEDDDFDFDEEVQLQEEEEERKRLTGKKRKRKGKKDENPSKRKRQKTGLRYNDLDFDDPENQKNWSEIRKKTYGRRKTHPNAYYYRFLKPGESQRNGPWSKAEKKQFLQEVKTRDLNHRDDPLWGMFSIEFVGRVGYQCSNFYRALVKIGVIEDTHYKTDEYGNLKMANRKLFGKKDPRYNKKKKKRKGKRRGRGQRYVNSQVKYKNLKSFQPSYSVGGDGYVNPLPDVIDHITNEKMTHPMVSEHGFVLDRSTWRRQERCPFTKMKNNRRKMRLLTTDNVLLYLLGTSSDRYPPMRIERSQLPDYLVQCMDEFKNKQESKKE